MIRIKSSFSLLLFFAAVFSSYGSTAPCPCCAQPLLPISSAAFVYGTFGDQHTQVYSVGNCNTRQCAPVKSDAKCSSSRFFSCKSQFRMMANASPGRTPAAKITPCFILNFDGVVKRACLPFQHCQSHTTSHSPFCVHKSPAGCTLCSPLH